MPKTKVKEQPFFLKNWRPITAVASAIILLSGLAVVATEQYNQGQISAAEAAETAIDLGEQQIKEITDRVDDLELAIRNAEQLLADTKDKTLDEVDRDALLAEIETGKETWVAQKTRLLELEAAVDSLKNEVNSEQSARETLTSLIRIVTEASRSNWEEIVNQVSEIGRKVTAVEYAQALWEKEQEVIAAEREAIEAERIAKEVAETAARLAEARSVPTASTLTDEGGSSAVTSPSPPAANAPPKQGPTSEAFNISVAQARQEGTNLVAFIEAYIRELATNVVFDWSNEELCDSRYICGQAEVGITMKYLEEMFPSLISSLPSGFPVEQVVIIRLDPRIVDLYVSANGIGRFVLVHEAAHARQWLKYGSNIILANEAYTGPGGVKGTGAVEYMADCMTISYLGYSVAGSYTTSCTPEQFVSANSAW